MLVSAKAGTIYGTQGIDGMAPVGHPTAAGAIFAGGSLQQAIWIRRAQGLYYAVTSTPVPPRPALEQTMRSFPSWFSTARRCAVQVIFACVLVSTASAWIYPEHREITLRAIRKLDPTRRAVLDKLWAEARLGNEPRLAGRCRGQRAGGGNHDDRLCGAWPAIAGDHSISGANLLHNVLETRVGPGGCGIRHAPLKARTATAAESRAERMNHLRDSDIELQRVDPEYATRAGSNHVHFLLARTAAGC